LTKSHNYSGSAIYYLAASPEMQSVTGKFFNQTIEEKPASYILKEDLQKSIWEQINITTE